MYVATILGTQYGLCHLKVVLVQLLEASDDYMNVSHHSEASVIQHLSNSTI